MAYYGGYQTSQYGAQPSYWMPQPSAGLASYAGYSYRVNQPSYSTNSDNNNNNNNTEIQYAPMPNYGYNYPSSGYMGNYGAPVYVDQYQPQPPTYSYSQTQPVQTVIQAQPSRSGVSEPVPTTTLEDVSQLAPQIEQAYEEAAGKRRQPVVKRQVITVPGEPGRVQTIVRRLPTPTPDIIERVFVVKPQRDVVNLVIERPRTPPAQIKDKTVVGKSRRPLIQPKIVSVQPRFQQIQYPYQYALPAPPTSSYAYQQPQVQPVTTATSTMTSQPQISQSRMSQVSQAQMPTQSTSSQKSRGYLVAPVQYEDYVQQQPTSYVQVPAQPLTPSYVQQEQTLSYTQVAPQPVTTTVMPAGIPYAYAAPSYPSYFAHTAGFPTPYGARVF